MVIIALDSVPWFVGGGAQHSSAVARMVANAAFRGNEGIIGPLDLRVHQQAAPAGSVLVDVGAASVIQFNTNELYGMYAARNITQETVAIAPTGGAIRSDLIVLRVENPFISGEGWAVPGDVTVGPYVFLRVLSGVPNTTTSLRQVVGSTTQSGIAIARIDIPVSTTNITDAMIVDLRRVANPRRDRILNTAFPVADNDLTSATVVDWPSAATWSVAVPSWATNAKIITNLAQVLVPSTGTNITGTLRMILGSTPTTTTGYNIDTAATANRHALVSGGSIAISAAMRGTTQTLKSQGLRSAGTNFLRANVHTTVFADIEFSEGPVQS